MPEVKSMVCGGQASNFIMMNKTFKNQELLGWPTRNVITATLHRAAEIELKRKKKKSERESQR